MEEVEATPLAGDDSFEESKTSEKSLQMRILDPINDPGWDHVVALHRDAGCFHTSAWAKVLQQTYNHPRLDWRLKLWLKSDGNRNITPA